MELRFTCEHIHNYQSCFHIKHFMHDLDFKEGQFFLKRKEKPVTNMHHKPVPLAQSLSYYILALVYEICLSVYVHMPLCYFLNSLNCQGLDLCI